MTYMDLDLTGFTPSANQGKSVLHDWQMYERFGGCDSRHRRWDGIRRKPWYKRVLIRLGDLVFGRKERQVPITQQRER